MAQASPIIQDEQLTYQQGGSTTHVMVGTAGWYDWLQTASTFAFQSGEDRFTARKERAGNRRGETYWRAYRKRGGKLYRAYLGKSEELTLERLRAAAAKLAGRGSLEELSQTKAHEPGAAPLQISETARVSQHRSLSHLAYHSPRLAEPDYSSTSRRAFPTGTITVFFADIEGSTFLLRRLGERYAHILIECRDLLRTALMQYNGFEVDTQGDAFFVVFARASDAIQAAVAVQRALASRIFPQDAQVQVRMGLHTGEPQRTVEGYIGLDVHRAARIMSAAHGGQVLLSQATCSLVEQDLPEDVTLRDLGEHHLKGLERPMHLFQLVIADLPADFPPLHTLESLPNNLPVQATPFLGREHEVAVLSDLLRREDVRLVTLTGSGGAGKTRLALQVATEVSDQFKSGVFFVNLAPLSEPALVVPTIAETLAVRESRDRSLLEGLVEELRQRKMLLLLDNFEQVVSAAEQVVSLLAACPQLKVLVTSREVLHVRAEHEFPVTPLAVPDPDHLPDLATLSRLAAVALFLQQAQAVKPAFQLTDANARAIAELCTRLDGLPLAIELAAARMKLFSPRALLARLGQSLAVLTGVSRDVPARQQTLRNTIAWSYHLLNAREQWLFRQLAVFMGGCQLSAIEAVCTPPGSAADSILDGVTSLVDKSLLQHVEQQTGEGSRFVMLETIREYALECLESSGETQAARKSHALYFLQLAEQAERDLGGPQQARWLEQLEEERDNLRAVMQWSLAQTEDGGKMALLLGGALGRFWYLHSDFSEGWDFLERALRRGDGGAASVRAKALYAAARLHEAQGNHDQAEVLCEQSLALYRELADPWGVAASLHLLADVTWGQGNLALSRLQAEESLARFREVGDRGQVGYVLIHLGALAVERGEYIQARSLLEESLAIHRALGDTSNIALSLFRLAELYHLSGSDLAQAHALLDESFALYREVDDKACIANCHSLSGVIALAEGNTGSARSQVEQALAVFKEMKLQRRTALSLYTLAQVAEAEGAIARSQALYEQGAVLACASGDKPTIPAGLEGLAAAVAAQGNHVWAAHLWGAAEALREALGTPIPPIERASYQRRVASSRIQCGERAFATVWARGRTLSPEQALASPEQGAASASTQSPSPTAASPASYPDGLTAREVEVLGVVAEGLTNEQVAERLIISPRTVDTHLTSIYSKIGVSSRAAATRYAIEHHLV